MDLFIFTSDDQMLAVVRKIDRINDISWIVQTKQIIRELSNGPIIYHRFGVFPSIANH